jgi:hypothetical protein
MPKSGDVKGMFMFLTSMSIKQKTAICCQMFRRAKRTQVFYVYQNDESDENQDKNPISVDEGFSLVYFVFLKNADFLIVIFSG